MALRHSLQTESELTSMQEESWGPEATATHRVPTYVSSLIHQTRVFAEVLVVPAALQACG